MSLPRFACAWNHWLNLLDVKTPWTWNPSIVEIAARALWLEVKLLQKWSKGTVELSHSVLWLWEASKQIAVEKSVTQTPEQVNNFRVPPSSQKWAALGDQELQKQSHPRGSCAVHSE